MPLPRDGSSIILNATLLAPSRLVTDLATFPLAFGCGTPSVGRLRTKRPCWRCHRSDRSPNRAPCWTDRGCTVDGPDPIAAASGRVWGNSEFGVHTERFDRAGTAVTFMDLAGVGIDVDLRGVCDQHRLCCERTGIAQRGAERGHLACGDTPARRPTVTCDRARCLVGSGRSRGTRGQLAGGGGASGRRAVGSDDRVEQQ